MNVIIYWKSGDYADVYGVDEVRTPNRSETDLRLIKRLGEREVEVARFRGEEVRGWQIFLTADDAVRERRSRAGDVDAS